MARVVENLIVKPGATLTIEAGVTVKFAEGQSLQVDGTMVAKGTEDSRITFTSEGRFGSSGDWGFVRFSDESEDAKFDGEGQYASGSVLQYCVVTYGGGASGKGGIQINDATPYIDHCEIVENKGSGIFASNPKDIRIENSLISGKVFGVR